MTCLFYDHAAAKLCKVEFRVARTQGPLDFQACFFSVLSFLSPIVPPLHGKCALPFSHLELSPGLSIHIYLSETQSTDLSEQSA